MNYDDIILQIPSTEEDLKGAELQEYYDIEIQGKYYNVYKIRGFVHTVGGRRGVNDLYICRRDKPLTLDNIRLFRSNIGTRYSYRISEILFNDLKRSDRVTLDTNLLEIFRNDEVIYTTTHSDYNTLEATAKTIMSTIKCHEADLNRIDYDKYIIGRKIQFNSIPVIVTSFIRHESNMHLEPDYSAMINKISSGCFTAEELKLFSQYESMNLYKEELSVKSKNNDLKIEDSTFRELYRLREKILLLYCGHININMFKPAVRFQKHYVLTDIFDTRLLWWERD